MKALHAWYAVGHCPLLIERERGGFLREKALGVGLFEPIIFITLKYIFFQVFASHVSERGVM